MKNSTKRCPRCVGSGTLMGGGMIQIDCTMCYGTGNIADKGHESKSNQEPFYIDVDRRSKSYRQAIAKIMDVHNVERQKAVKIFDEEFQRLPV